MSAENLASRWLDPHILMQIGSLELRARHIVEGFWSGLHRSPYHGYSVEFTEYRPYTLGDDPRHLDWRVLARTDRHYVKRFEDETNLRCLVLLDASRSMDFGSVGYSKFEYARTLVATLAYFLLQQHDAVGLARFSHEVDDYLPPRLRTGHWQRLLVSLEAPCTGRFTNLVTPLEQIAERLRHRGLFVLLTDALGDVERLAWGLECLLVRGQEVLVFQILDRAELTLPYDDPEMYEDLESGQQVYVDPSSYRPRYQQRIQAHLSQVELVCHQTGASFHRFLTDEPLGGALGDVLQARLRSRDRRTAKRRF
ncbi:MAG: hypothetical protein KatS3mg114_1162 [Planctomycetaceae bacterium]|nr:MAG: hypothetical protein KatS3mg114_1162 [Planctomycetaceae bacterium]